MENTTKGRYWTFLVFKQNWEENPNWKQKLIDTHLRFCISPIHDRDIWCELDIQKHPDRADYIKEHLGEPKTPHFHVMIHCDDNTTFKTMKDMTDELGLPIPFRVVSPCGMYSYFTHEYDPEKAQYNTNDIMHYNGSEPSDYIMDINKEKKSRMLFELSSLIIDKQIGKYHDIEILASNMKDPNYLYLVQTNTHYFKQILVDSIMTTKKKQEEAERKMLAKGRKYDGK